MRVYFIYLRDGKEIQIDADYFKQDDQRDEIIFYKFGYDGKEDKFIAVFRYWIGLKTFDDK